MQVTYKCFTYYIDLFTAAMFLTLCGLFYYWVNIRIPKGRVVEKEYEEKYGSLYRDVPLYKGYFARRLLSVCLSFKIAYALAIAALIEYPYAQVIVAIFLNGSYIIYLGAVRPYNSLKLNYINIFNYCCLELLLIMKLMSTLIDGHEMVMGLVMGVLFLLPIVQSLVIFGVEYYFTLIKAICLKVKVLIAKCRDKKRIIIK